MILTSNPSPYPDPWVHIIRLFSGMPRQMPRQGPWITTGHVALPHRTCHGWLCTRVLPCGTYLPLHPTASPAAMSTIRPHHGKIHGKPGGGNAHGKLTSGKNHGKPPDKPHGNKARGKVRGKTRGKARGKARRTTHAAPPILAGPGANRT